MEHTLRRFFVSIRLAVGVITVEVMLMTMSVFHRTTVRTGQLCPVSGVWKVDDPIWTTTAPIAIGNRMPPYKGLAVTWVLLYEA